MFAADLKRDVISFWDSSEVEEDEYTFSNTHRHLESVFNHFGLRLKYVDVRKPFPTWLLLSGSLKNFRGIVSWLTGNNMEKPDDYMNILKRAKKEGVPLLLLGEPGFHEISPNKAMPKEKLVQFWSNMGLKYNGSYYNNPLLIKLNVNAPNIKDIQFERDFEGETPNFWGLSVEEKGLRPWIITTLSQSGRYEFHPVVVGENLAIFQKGYEIFTNPLSFKVEWRMNPFKIVKDLFIKEIEPIPDVTTVCNNRASFIHIDGDGFINISLIDKKSLSGEIIMNDIIKKYKFPTSVSIVTAEIIPKYLGSRRTVNAVKELVNLPYVESASHTFRHPLSWERKPNIREKKIYLDDEEIKNHKGPIVAYEKEKGELNYEEEVLGSLKYINDEILENKKTNLLFWTGSCRPPVEALSIVEKNNILSINGGDGRYDSSYPSYTGLAPHFRKIDNYVQVYSAFANENIYTNLWSGPYSGFRNVIESFKNTEEPYRIKPINIYYHFYSGERVSSVKALDEIYSFLNEQKVTPIFTSDYIKMVHDWDKIKIRKITSNDFEIREYGSSRTLRIDLNEEKEMFPDYELSKNVIGHRLVNKSLYIMLSKGDLAKVTLTSIPPTKSYIYQCNGIVDEYKKGGLKGESRVSFEAEIREKNLINFKKTSHGQVLLKWDEK
ncbi:MAG: hypothetical protein K9K67_07055 [Bacteriovoracaceae bacterium]|nr:hypothetical protein [Bacteriovoracaceae bacterium]